MKVSPMRILIGIILLLLAFTAGISKPIDYERSAADPTAVSVELATPAGC
jgi:hypothetical protein